MWRQLLFHNDTLREGVRRSLASKLVKINPDTQLIELSSSARTMAYDANWIFFGHNTACRDCFTWHSIMFNCFDGFVHEFCKLRCWKVVVKTGDFITSMRFRAAVLAGPHFYGDLVPIMGKVGKDERDYTDKPFNGFIYCDGPKDAQEKYAYIRKLVNELIPDGKNIPVIIKRSCTEFEKRHGPTDGEFWQSMTDDELVTQHLLEDIYSNLKASSTQPDWLINKLIYDLALWANAHGDKTWMEYFNTNDEDFLTMAAVTYHEPEKKEVKQGAKKRSTAKKKVSK